MLKLEKTKAETYYYTASGPLTYQDIATLRKHSWLSLISGESRMWWQDDKSSSFLFNNNLARGNQRFHYDPSDPTALDRLNAAWAEFTSES